MYAKGQGVIQDYKEALKWFRLAAAQGDAKAQYNLGVMYDNGEGVTNVMIVVNGVIRKITEICVKLDSV